MMPSPLSLASSSLRSSKKSSLNTIESSVTRLLVSTKHLLESLTQWARQEADDKFVSDAYVKLGNDFRSATRAFTGAGVDISELGDVPQALRIILEAALSEAPSQENLDRFLPNIRNIIVTLLQNLKAKQVKARTITQEKNHRSRLEDVSTTTANVVAEVHSRTSSVNHSRIPSNNLPPYLSVPVRDQAVQNDALTQLQKGDAMQRRASRRFSAYQYAKLTNFQSNGLPKIEASVSSRAPSSNHAEPPSTNLPETTLTHIYLKINNKTKKVDIKLPVSFASLRLLFVEKFAYSPGSLSFPDIYIQDPKSGVSYELEDHLLKDVQFGSLLCLNEPDSLEHALKGLEKKMMTLNTRFDTVTADITTQMKEAINAIEIPPPIIQQVSPVPPVPVPVTESSNLKQVVKAKEKRNDSRELGSIQQELKVIRQLQSTSKDSIKDVINGLVSKIKDFQESGLDVSKTSNRSYMETCLEKLSEESDGLLTKVDDLQDILEALRKDVAQRGVRVGEKQLKNTQKEIEEAKTALKEMNSYISKEKSVWKKIWESELDKVCEEQQFFNLQDDLTQDLEEDIKKIEETYDLIEQCSLEQSKQTSFKRHKVVAQMHIPEPGESLHNLKDALLNEVVALRPNHEGRLEAIEKAERLREKERELTKLSKFQEELGEFVDDNKLKKSGGIDELERLRKLKDLENFKSSFGVI